MYNPEVFEYPNYILNIQSVNATLKESIAMTKVKKTISQELSLDEERLNPLQLLDFLFVPESQLFILVYPSKICFFDRDAIIKQQDDRMKHMNFFLKGVKNLAKGHLAQYENNNFLLISTKV